MHRNPTSLAALLLVATLAGCPGAIDDPAPYFAATSGACDEADAQALLGERCTGAGCHSGAEPAGELDLASPSVGARLLGATSGCAERPLVDLANPRASYFLDKLNPEPLCGAPMPLIGDALSPTEVRCLESFVDSLVLTGGAFDASVPADGGTP